MGNPNLKKPEPQKEPPARQPAEKDPPTKEPAKEAPTSTEFSRQGPIEGEKIPLISGIV